MATFLSDIAATPARAPRFGGVIARRAKIQIPTGFVANDVLQFFQLPQGAIILDGAVLTDDLGGGNMFYDLGYLGGTINGVPEDPNAFIDAGSGNTVSLTVFDEVTTMIDLGPLDAERPLAATFTTVTTPTVGADVVCYARYVLSA